MSVFYKGDLLDEFETRVKPHLRSVYNEPVNRGDVFFRKDSKTVVKTTYASEARSFEVAHAKGVGVPVKVISKSIYFVEMEKLELTLKQYVDLLRASEEDTAASWHDLDAHLTDLLTRLVEKETCHTDLSENNIMLNRKVVWTTRSDPWNPSADPWVSEKKVHLIETITTIDWGGDADASKSCDSTSRMFVLLLQYLESETLQILLPAVYKIVNA
jgi:hypothetical protein